MTHSIWFNSLLIAALILVSPRKALAALAMIPVGLALLAVASYLCAFLTLTPGSAVTLLVHLGVYCAGLLCGLFLLGRRSPAPVVLAIGAWFCLELTGLAAYGVFPPWQLIWVSGTFVLVPATVCIAWLAQTVSAARR